MTLVWDASAATKLLLAERGTAVARRLWEEADGLVAPAIVLPEVAAAVGAAHRAGRLSRQQADEAQALWRRLSPAIALGTVGAGLADAARELAATHRVRGMDAVYLALALRLADAGPTALASFDTAQRAAARDAGLALAPAAWG